MTGGGSRAALVIGSALMPDLGSLFVSSCPSPDAVEEWVRLRSGTVVAGRVVRFFVDADTAAPSRCSTWSSPTGRTATTRCGSPGRTNGCGGPVGGCAGGAPPGSWGGAGRPA
ncbi:hypothetical protein [Amycolatopsis vastitatis]|uniref:hypothetical protein n=1 Tax=Amycolatopsis vastitatis TaxID=1905142 RepID=UPI001F0A3460|nr:hypothetical protein [Amycolatopsis vastitatis]